MAGEDAASVLDHFVIDAANLPAETAHLLEEIEAKDRVVQECRNVIHTQDAAIQKFIRAHGSLVPNPREKQCTQIILEHFDRAQAVQEEKFALSEKASLLLDRYVKRLDLKIRDLQNEGSMPNDPPLPSLLYHTEANKVPPVSANTTGTNTPLLPLSGNVPPGPSTTIANSSLARLMQNAGLGSTNPNAAHRQTSEISQPHNPLLNPARLGASTPASPTATSNHNHYRESSAGAADASATKRRRLLGSIPSTSSNLARQSSLGPTPKAGSSTPSGVRAGSAGPRAGLKKGGPARKLAPHQQVRKLKTGKSGRRIGKRALGSSGVKASSSSTGEDEDSMLSEMDGSEAEASVASGRGGGNRGGTVAGGGGGVSGNGDKGMANAVARMDEMEDVEDDGGDDRKYCTCRSVSYGNMVACDNDQCPYEWFHWSCVGMTKEPVGTWYCDECKAKLGAS